MTHHLRSIPFENLMIQLGERVRIGLEDVFRTLVECRRGGYCFQHNRLFQWVLQEMGLEVTPMAARIRRSASELRPLTHMILRVRIDTTDYLVDVGFGAEGPRAPIPLSEGHLRVDRDGFRHTLRSPQGEDPWVLHLGDSLTDTDLYAFDLRRHHSVDYEMYNHFTSTYPGSHFLQGLICQLHTSGGYKSLFRRSYRRCQAGTVTEHEVGSGSELEELLRREFHLEIDNAGRLWKDPDPCNPRSW